jgi:LPXTG-motif cell wall-anchored protein
LTFLLFIFPVAIYGLVLSHLNRGRHPVLLRGTWDFAGVLLAASGFLIVGAPAILNGLYQDRRLAWARGEMHFLPNAGAGDWYIWAALWAGYYAAVLGGAAYLLWRRRNKLSIYNIDADVLDQALQETLHRLGVDGSRMANRLVLHVPAMTTAASGTPAPWVGEPAPAVPVLEVDTFPSMRHATLAWLTDPGPTRAAFERELGSVLEEVPSEPNPVAAWFLGIALLLLCVTFLGLVALLFLITFARLAR